MSRRHGSGVSVGHDAFLDIVANLVGILIILVVVLGAQSQTVLQEAQKVTPELIEPDREVAGEGDMRQLAVVATRTASARLDSDRLERTIKAFDAKLAKQQDTRAVMLALLEEAEAAWENEQSKLDQSRRETAQKEAKALQLQKALKDLAGETTRLTGKTPPTIAISHLPTPMAKTVFGEEVYFRLKNNRLSSIPFQELTEEIRRDFQRGANSRREGVMDAAVGPVKGYIARYVMNRSNELVSRGNSVAQMTRARVMVASFEPLSEPYGVPVETALANDDWLDIALTGHSPETTTVTIAVYPDSYGSFRKLKERIYAKGYASAARPIEDGRPIFVNFSGGGSNSVAQ